MGDYDTRNTHLAWEEVSELRVAVRKLQLICIGLGCIVGLLGGLLLR